MINYNIILTNLLSGVCGSVFTVFICLTSIVLIGSKYNSFSKKYRKLLFKTAYTSLYLLLNLVWYFTHPAFLNSFCSILIIPPDPLFNILSSDSIQFSFSSTFSQRKLKILPLVWTFYMKILKYLNFYDLLKKICLTKIFSDSFSSAFIKVIDSFSICSVGFE